MSKRFINISKGMINGLAKEFSQKTKEEQKELALRILSAPVNHIDYTNARINGKTAYVLVCANPNGEVMYYSRGTKEHEGIKGTIAEDYQNPSANRTRNITYKRYNCRRLSGHTSP